MNVILRNVSYKNNEKIKMYQQINLLKNSIIKYPKVTKFKKYELEFIDMVKIKIQNNQIYETPGYMPYLQQLKNPYFSYIDKKVYLNYSLNNITYKKIIFYDK